MLVQLHAPQQATSVISDIAYGSSLPMHACTVTSVSVHARQKLSPSRKRTEWNESLHLDLTLAHLATSLYPILLL